MNNPDLSSLVEIASAIELIAFVVDSIEQNGRPCNGDGERIHKAAQRIYGHLGLLSQEEREELEE